MRRRTATTCHRQDDRNLRAAGPEVETPVLPETDEETALEAPWNVLLHNDPVNLMSYVVMILRRVFGFSRGKAEEIMLSVHETGRGVVWTGERETAEMYVEQLHGFQLQASLEKVEL